MVSWEFTAFDTAVKTQMPGWVNNFWLPIMGIVTMLGALIFIKHKTARWLLLANILNIIAMPMLYSVIGLSKLLGIVHIITLTPIFVYFIYELKHNKDTNMKTWYGKWIHLVTIVIGISLIFDYTDVLGYLLGFYT